MSKLSYTLCGGFGDFILRYLGSPGDRLHYLTKQYDIEFRVSNNEDGIDLIKGNPFFAKAVRFQETNQNYSSRLQNDIAYIKEIDNFPKLIPSLWLSEEEESVLSSVKKPYSVYHAFAGHEERSLIKYDYLKDWIEETSGMPVIILNKEQYSSRLAISLVKNATFFVGSHSSMQCAAWIYDIPSLCIGPDKLYLHNYYAPNSFDMYLKPLYKNNGVFVPMSQMLHFGRFLDHFLRTATCLTPQQPPELLQKKLFLSSMVYEPL